jgi:hypothetical protein
MKCSFCGNEIQGNSSVEENGLYFCNPLHRYSYKESKGTIASTTNQSSQSSVKPQLHVPNDFPKESSQEASSRMGSAIGALIGIAASTYFGMSGFIPLVLFFLLLWLLNKIKTISGYNRFAIAIQGSQLLWMTLGGIIAGAWGSVYLDLIILVIGIIWLLLRFGIGPIVLLGLYHIGSIYINAALLMQTEVGSINFKALIVHIILRLLAIFFMIRAFIQYRKEITPAIRTTNKPEA